jgi:hypothetical protein
MSRVLLSVLLLLSAASLVVAKPFTLRASTLPQTTTPSRKVRGLTLTSDGAPRVRIGFAKGFRYVGGQSFVLYDVANAEQHFFVDADARGHIRRLYWVQFEGYLPSNRHTYDYKSTNVVRVGGLDFIADSQARQIPSASPDLASQPANKISDGDRARSFLASKGLMLASNEALWQRLVHMTDASKRSELMIIYLEDLAGTGLTVADLSEGGSAVSRWEAVSKELLGRARRGMTIARW